MTEQAKNGEKYSIVTCSALKRQYRDILRGAEGKVAFIHLTPPQTSILSVCCRVRGII